VIARKIEPRIEVR